MCQTSLLFKVKDTSNNRVLEIFFKAWVDETCNNEVEYALESDISETFRVDFERFEDAVALKLKGIPQEFQKYLEFANSMS